jgi:hypothetical protein
VITKAQQLRSTFFPSIVFLNLFCCCNFKKHDC